MRAEPVEEILQAGNGGRLFAVLSTPRTGMHSGPVFVFFNAGLVNRTGPSRMSVRLCRALAASGYPCIRFDLTGKGDTPAAPGEDYLATVKRDFEDLRHAIKERFGQVQYVLGGLCSGADNVVRMANGYSDVIGMLLLDPMCYPDKRFPWHALVDRYVNWRQYIGKLRALAIPRQTRHRPGQTEDDNPLSLRVLPSARETSEAVGAVHERGGSTLAIFTAYAQTYYKHSRQFTLTTVPHAFDAASEELWWRDVEHTYKALPQLERLEQKVVDWAALFST
ncbi:MAG: alpha/beta hydrolase [Pseudomonadota bacterium]